MLKKMCALMVLLLVTACGAARHGDYFRYTDEGVAKPVVALLPVIDRSDSGLCWSLSDELTEGLYDEAREEGALFLIPRTAACQYAERWKNEDLFGKELGFTRCYRKGEFLVFMELIEHRMVPYEKGKIEPLYPVHCCKCDSVLLMKLRVRILDMRCPDEPKIVLQEIFQSNHMISRGGDQVDYKTCTWKSDRYSRTAFSIAHQRLMKDVMRRIEKIICR